MIELTNFEKNLHARALAVSFRFLKSEIELIEILEEVERSRFYRKMEFTSLFQYARAELKLSEAVAGSFIAVARKAREVPALKKAIFGRTLSVSVAHKMVSTVTEENSLELIHFAQTHSCRELERKIAGINPKVTRDQVRAVSEDQMKILITLSKEEYEILLRAQTLLSQKLNSKSAKLKDAVVQSAKDFVERHDPLKKAERQEVRAQKKVKTAKAKANNSDKTRAETTAISSEIKFAFITAETKTSVKTELPGNDPSRERFTRKPLTAAQKHAVFLKTQGRCTYVTCRGERCENKKWIYIHHIQPVSQGGGNQPENLTHLCWEHHDLVHQLPLPINLELTRRLE